MAQVGDIVHYVLEAGPNTGQCRAAIILCVRDRVNGIVDLKVLVVAGDATRNSGYASGDFPVLYVEQSPPGERMPGRWHYRGPRLPNDSPRDCAE